MGSGWSPFVYCAPSSPEVRSNASSCRVQLQDGSFGRRNQSRELFEKPKGLEGNATRPIAPRRLEAAEDASIGRTEASERRHPCWRARLHRCLPLSQSGSGLIDLGLLIFLVHQEVCGLRVEAWANETNGTGDASLLSLHLNRGCVEGLGEMSVRGCGDRGSRI
jgi:hypothetical protein